MFFELDKNIDVTKMLVAGQDHLDSNEFCRQILDNGIRISSYATSAEVKQWKDFYMAHNPSGTLLIEEYLSASATSNDVKRIFQQHMQPLDLANCPLTIIDPYLLQPGLDLPLLKEIIKTNCLSKKLKIITQSIDQTIRATLEADLLSDGFSVTITQRSDLHDRWWYSRKNGFTCGISFNGIRKKNTTVKKLEDDELNEIISNYGV